MTTEFTKDGYIRRIYSDAVHWVLAPQARRRVDYVVARFPFVPDYHLCEFVEDDPHTYKTMPHVCERPLQQFKTLAQALAVLRVIEGSNP